MKKKREDEEAVEVQRQADEDTKKKGSVQPPVSFFACLLWQFGSQLGFQSGQVVLPINVMAGPSKHKVSGHT